jgi:hypothetical protein
MSGLLTSVKCSFMRSRRVTLRGSPFIGIAPVDSMLHLPAVWHLVTASTQYDFLI